ncbi:MAG TPA: MarR family transcriptional regulator [Ktedonobacterales bacterium]|nr:MarR family transcriptional regulator [Ktedonobacterales bacterium]
MQTKSMGGGQSMDATSSASAPDAHLTKAEYERLANLRYVLRRFARLTELEARKVNLTPQQYQLLLAIKGFPGRDWVSITELAERLQIRHNAVIGLVNRAVQRGLVRREHDPEHPDRRIVKVSLTPEAEGCLRKLAAALRSERQRVRIAAAEADLG